MPWASGSVQFDIPDEGYPDYATYYGEHGLVVDTLSEEVDTVTGDERDLVASLQESLREEVAEGQPTLYETYNAATRAITHAPDLPAERQDMALDQAAALLDTAGGLPDPTDLGL